MAQKTDAQLTTQAQEIRDETVTNANTALRVGTMLEDIIESKVNNDEFTATDTTGTAISFAVPQFYGSSGSPETGNVTLVTTGMVKGMMQVLFHNSGSEPTWPSEFVRKSGEYIPGSLNTIYMLAISTTQVHYTICQDI